MKAIPVAVCRKMAESPAFYLDVIKPLLEDPEWKTLIIVTNTYVESRNEP